jgi:hypothetical protein
MLIAGISSDGILIERRPEKLTAIHIFLWLFSHGTVAAGEQPHRKCPKTNRGFNRCGNMFFNSLPTILQ